MATTRYRPRNTPIRALQWTGDNAAAMTAFAAKRFAETAPEDRTDDPESTAALLETDHDTWFDLQAGDWVIRRAGGWFGVLDNAEFTDQYEADPEQPAAAPSVPADADLRDRIAQALAREDAHNAGYDHGFTSSYGSDEETDGFVDAVLTVLPAPADRAAVLRKAADAIVADNDRQMWATKPGKHWAADLLRRMADEAQQAAAQATEVPLVCEGFQWIGQPFTTCDRCGQPAWDHAGEDVAVDGAAPFDNRRTVRPWKPGEADAIRAKWAPTEAVEAQQAKAEAPVWCGATELAFDREIAARATAGLVGYRQDNGRLLHCLAHKPAPASRHADFHEIGAADLDEGGVCVHWDCGRDLLAAWPTQADEAQQAGEGR